MRKNDIKKTKRISLAKAEEPELLYPKSKAPKQLMVKDFLFEDFKEIADKGPFTQAEWAAMLSISERTIQRYSKENSAFNGLQTERILHLSKLIDKGNLLFGKAGFRSWLDYAPYSINGVQVRNLLSSYQGIETAIDLLGKLEHGIPA